MTYIPFKENNEGEVMWTEFDFKNIRYICRCAHDPVSIKMGDFKTKTFLDV